MRIAVSNWSRRHAGGIEGYLSNVIPELMRRGHEVAMISEIDEPMDRDVIVPAGISLDLCADRIGSAKAFAALRDWRPDVIYAQQFLRLEFEQQLMALAPAVAFAQAYYGTCISGSKTHRLPSTHPCTRKLGPGCLVRFYPNRCGGLNPLTTARLYSQQKERLKLMRGYSAVVTFSDHMVREYERHGIPAWKLWKTASEGYAGAVNPRKPPDPGEPWRLMFLGRFDHLKGIDVLLDAVSVVAENDPRPLVLRLTGDGVERARIERRARTIMARHPHVVIGLTGWLTGAALEREWESANALVMPSIWPEPFGIAGIEAGTRGLPVVAFAVGGIPEWLEDGVNGFLAEIRGNSARNLAERLVLLMSSSTPYTSLSEGAERLSRRFEMENHVVPLLEILERAGRSNVRPSA